MNGFITQRPLIKIEFAGKGFTLNHFSFIGLQLQERLPLGLQKEASTMPDMARDR